MECNIYKAGDPGYNEAESFHTLKEFCDYIDTNSGVGANVMGGIIIMPLADGSYDLRIYDSEVE